MGRSYKDAEDFDPKWKPKRHKYKNKAQELTHLHYDDIEEQLDFLDDEWEDEDFEKFRSKK